MLGAYFAMARAQIESHCYVVEKFIGDAVVGVLGLPAAHEDDPERAVRAALRIAEDAESLEAVGGSPASPAHRHQHRAWGTHHSPWPTAGSTRQQQNHR
jgi:class 3 adenylate cyclase